MQSNISKYTLPNNINIFCIPVSTPFPVGKINAYLIESDELTLIDCGPLRQNSITSLEEGFEAVNKRLEDVDNLIITHGHLDHHGLAKYVKDKSNASIYAHELDVLKIEDFTAERKKIISLYENFLLHTGIPLNEYAKIGRMYSRNEKLAEPVNVDFSLKGGETITKTNLEIIHTPGHTEGAICLHIDSILFSGDTVLNEITPNPFFKGISEFAGLGNFINSMKKLLKLENIEITLTGHGSPVKNLKNRLNEVIHHHEIRKDTILNLCKTEKTAYELTQEKELFENELKGELFLGIIEVVSHLEVLIDEKKLETFEKSDSTYYRAICSEGLYSRQS